MSELLRHPRHFPTILVLLCLALSMPALAQDGEESDGLLEEILVTAARTGAKSIQDVPLAISAFSGAALERSGITNIEGVATLTPGLNYTANGPWAIASIRGIGTNQTFVGGDPSTTLQVDGVYIGRPSAASLDLMDVERIEVLRGPQGTLYGRNAVAGTVNVITKDASDEFEGEVRAQLGTDSTNQFEGRFSGPLIKDTLAYSFSARYSEHGAYVDNLAEGRDDLWTDEYTALRGKLKWTANDMLTVTFAGDYTDQEGHYNWYSARLATPGNPLGSGLFDGLFIPDIHQAAFNEPHFMTNEIWGMAITAKVEFDSMTLISITSYREADMDLDVDIDMSAAELVQTAAFPEDSWQFSQEVTLNGSTDNLEWVGGVFLYHENGETLFNLELHEALVGANLLQTQGDDTISDSVAAFAQGTYSVSDKFSLTGGLRFTYDTKDVTNVFGTEVLTGPYPSDPLTIASNAVRTTKDVSFSEFTPKFGIEYRSSDETMLYGSITRGYKSGGFNLIVFDVPIDYDPEFVWAYEAGIKSTFADGRATLNATAYYYDYKGYQVTQFIGTGQEFTSNSDAVKASGLEVEGTLQVSDNFRLSGNVSFINAEYDDPNFSTTDNATGMEVIVDGNDLNDAPGFSGGVFGDYFLQTGMGTFAFRGEVSYKDDVFYHPSNNAVEMADSYTLVNASITFTDKSEHWVVALVGRNIFDKDYLSGAATFVVPGGRPGLPRVVTASVKYRF